MPTAPPVILIVRLSNVGLAGVAAGRLRERFLDFERFPRLRDFSFGGASAVAGRAAGGADAEEDEGMKAGNSIPELPRSRALPSFAAARFPKMPPKKLAAASCTAAFFSGPGVTAVAWNPNDCKEIGAGAAST